MKLIFHPNTAEQLEALVRRVSGSHIWTGPIGIGKQTAARWLMMKALCKQGACGVCEVCRQILHQNSSDIVTLEPNEKGNIGIAQTKEFIQALHLKRYSRSNFRLALIIGADTMTTEAQNSLLKTLEEPPEGTMMLMTATVYTKLLPTIRSRCNHVAFIKPNQEELRQYLVNTFKLAGARAEEILQASSGLPGIAVKLAQKDKASDAGEPMANQEAREIFTRGLFKRLVVAARLADEPAFAVELELEIRRGLRDSKSNAEAFEWSKRLEALEAYYRHRSANVPTKTALEALMVKL